MTEIIALYGRRDGKAYSRVEREWVSGEKYISRKFFQLVVITSDDWRMHRFIA